MTTRTKKATAAPQAKAPKNPRNAAYSNAERRLREAHPEEFQVLLQEETEALGLTYKRRLTAEERAEQQRQEALAKALRKMEEAKLVIDSLGGGALIPTDGATEPDPLA